MDRATIAGDAAPQASSLLAILQFADSFFPSGASAFSWGLESMNHDGLVKGADQVLALLTAIIEERWAGVDRGLMRAAHQASARCDVNDGEAPDFNELIRIDELCECMTLNQEGRAASRRLGVTQLKVHAGLGLPMAQAYLSEVQAQCAPGHLPVVHGLICQALGLSALEGEAMSAFGQCTAVVGAAIRLGMLGHVDGQRILMQMRRRIAAVLGTDPPELDDLWNGAPALELAAMRHETRSARLFAN
ncbi:urease accessory protein UreF [Aquabacterium sp.]|uniref:urease accessory protein UreF n=1 Tax=Aquabacterium sp. TaxID=1872578 RepID=UPI003D6C81B1